MQILSHRGYWKISTEKNSKIAFIRAFKLGFGIETDIRDHNGHLVISHNPPTGNCLSLEEFLGLYQLYGNNSILALNVKADGLQILLQEILNQFKIENYFLFDMSIPDTLLYLKQKMPIFTRLSEYEVSPIFYEQTMGIWIDCFTKNWFSKREITQYLEAGKKVCLVSPELHQRSHQSFWLSLRKWEVHHNQNLMLCTDLPELAKDYFYE